MIDMPTLTVNLFKSFKKRESIDEETAQSEAVLARD